MPVKIAVAETATLRRTTRQPATVHAYHTATLMPRATGYVRALLVDLGDQVVAGQPLAVIDVPDLEKDLLVQQAEVAHAEARRRQAAANAAAVRQQLAQAEAGVAEAEAQIAAAEAQAAAAAAEYDRVAGMVERQAVQQRLLDEARQRSEAAAAATLAAQAGAVGARSAVGAVQAAVAAADADVAASEAGIQVALAQRNALQQRIEFATLRAPFDGVVTIRGVDLGDLVRAASDARDGADPAFAIAQVARVRIRTTVPENDAPLVNVGDAVTIALAAELPPIEAAVTRTSGSLDPSTRTLTVEIDVENADGRLLPGMYGEATIVLSEKEAVTLPASAVRFSAAGASYVYALEGDAVRVVDVQIGYDNGKRLEIVTNLAAGQRVVDAHLRRLRTGDRVRPVE